MAMPVDSFHLLWDQLSIMCKESLNFDKNLLTCKNILVIIGGIYVAKKTFSLTCGVYRAVKEHGVARVVRCDPVKLYGRWAVVTGSTHGIGKAYAQELASKGCSIVVISLERMDCGSVAKSLVITGCTGGIGEAFSNELASRGMNIILLSRRLDSMRQKAKILEDQFGVETCIVPVDFNDGKPVYNGIRKALADKDIGILVNNVGVMYDYPQMFLDVPEEKLWQLVHVNVAAATMLTNIVLPGMIDRGRGAVVTVSSGSSIMPTPQMTVYSATKAYLDVFMRALSYEYKGSGVTFQVLLPFYVATRMTQYSTTLSNPSLFIPSATNYARSALTTLGWTERSTGYWPHMLQALGMSLFSEGMWMWSAMRLNDALRRQAFSRLQRRRSSKHKQEWVPPAEQGIRPAKPSVPPAEPSTH